MNSLWQMPAIVLALLAWLTSPPANLADVAQREALRRSATQKSQATLTNLGLPIEEVPPSAVSMPPVEAPPPAGDPAKPGEAAALPATTDPPRDEKWWRGKMTELRTTLEKDQLAAAALQSRVNALQADSVNIDDPLKQTKARVDLIRAIDEMEKTRKQIDADQRAITALQDQARRLNIPAGWIR